MAATNHSATNKVDRDAIIGAAQRIAPHIRTTPVMSVATPAGAAELKLEFMQLSGTFKARGAFNLLLSATPGSFAGVAAASGGNHGIAVACAAREAGVQADIFVPDVTPAAKRQAIEQFGATVHVGGAFYAEAFQACQAFAERTGALLSHAYDLPETLAGQGTVAREWQDQSAGLDTVLIAVGGGGLIGGIAAWFENDLKVVAVETGDCATLHNALIAGEPIDVNVGGIAADSLGARRCGELMFPIAQRFVDESILVSDAAVQSAQRWAWHTLRAPLEPGGATALAAWLEGAYRPAAGERVGILLCGANLAPPPGIAGK